VSITTTCRDHEFFEDLANLFTNVRPPATSQSRIYLIIGKGQTAKLIMPKTNTENQNMQVARLFSSINVVGSEIPFSNGMKEGTCHVGSDVDWCYN